MTLDDLASLLATLDPSQQDRITELLMERDAPWGNSDTVSLVHAARERERWAALRKAVIDHLVRTGPCGDADEYEASCDDPECTYCAIEKALIATAEETEVDGGSDG